MNKALRTAAVGGITGRMSENTSNNLLNCMANVQKVPTGADGCRQGVSAPNFLAESAAY